jgi:AsmA protein
VTPTRGLKPLILGVCLALAALGGLIAAMPVFLRADAVRAAIQDEIRLATGLEPELGESSALSAFPSSAVNFYDISLRAAKGEPPLLTAPKMTAQLRFLPLLLGRIDVAEVILTQPQVTIEFDDHGSSNWSAPLRTISHGLKPGSVSPARPVAFSEIRLVDGTIEVRDRARLKIETMVAVDASLAWPAISRSFGATGNFSWRGERIDATLSVADFHAALVGERSGIKVRVTSAPLKAAFDGHASYLPATKVDGLLSLDSVSLRNAVQWAGSQTLPGTGFERFSMKAQTSILGNTVALSNVNIDLDGNAAEGVLTLTGDKRKLLQGTLAAGVVDLTPYVRGVQWHDPHRNGWNQTPIALDGFGGIDFDVRLSSSQTLLGATRAGRSAIGATLRGGRLSVSIGELQTFGGVLRGQFGLGRTAGGADVKANLQFTDVDLDETLGTVFGIRRIEGRGDLQIALEGTGENVSALTHAVNGSATLRAERGALTGLNVEQMLRRLERRPLSGAGDFRSGRTQFERLDVKLKIAHGTIETERAELDGGSVRLAMDGTASIGDQNLNLKGVASLASAPRDARFELMFAVRGRWNDPIVVPDVQSLIQRSGAAAPLFDAARGGRAREAVRSAIEQMTSGADPAQAITPPAATSASQPAR